MFCLRTIAVLSALCAIAAFADGDPADQPARDSAAPAPRAERIVTLQFVPPELDTAAHTTFLPPVDL